MIYLEFVFWYLEFKLIAEYYILTILLENEMKILKQQLTILIFFILFAVSTIHSQSLENKGDRVKKSYFGIEIGGSLTEANWLQR